MYRKVPWVRIPLSPPCSLRLQRLRARIWQQPEKFPRFRGVLAGSPFCFRTRDRRFRAQKTPPPACFSVAKLPGSVSLAIRLGEGSMDVPPLSGNETGRRSGVRASDWNGPTSVFSSLYAPWQTTEGGTRSRSRGHSPSWSGYSVLAGSLHAETKVRRSSGPAVRARSASRGEAWGRTPLLARLLLV